MSRLPALRDLTRDLLADLRPEPTCPPPAIRSPRPAYVDHKPIPAASPAPRPYAPAVDPGTILDQFYQHTTALGAPLPEVVDWLATNRIPVSPAGTVLLMKGVRPDYRSKNGALYLPGHMVTDPDFGHRANAGVYLCPDRRTVATFMGFTCSWRLLVVEAGLGDLGLYHLDLRKIVARRVYVHREIPR